jgi:hypothetical protein
MHPTLARALLGEPSAAAGLDLRLSESAVSRTQRARAPRPAAKQERRVADPARPRALDCYQARTLCRVPSAAASFEFPLG